MSGTLFFSGLMTETSSFTNLPTTYRDFEPSLLRGDDCLFESSGEPRPGAAPLLKFAAARGWSVRAGISCHSSVGAPTLHGDYIGLRDELLDGVRNSAPNVVALLLHGGADSPVLEGDCGQQMFVQVDQIISAMSHCCYRHEKIATTSTSKRRGGSVSANLGASSTAGAISRAIRAIGWRKVKAAVQATDMTQTSLRDQLAQ